MDYDGIREDNIIQSLIDIITNILPLMYIAYAGFWIKSAFFDKRKYLAFSLALLFIIVSGVFALKLFGVNQGNTLFNNIINVAFVLLSSLGLQYFKRGIINQHQIQELRAKTAETELNALKAQINPHFLFNTLNNIYGMNQIDSNKGSEMILELSDVMRYHLEFSKMGTVRIEDEIQLIESYIKLESLRLTDNCKLQVDIEEVDQSLNISPLLFLSFVENAFKHGTHPIHPCFINLSLKSKENVIYFEIENSIIENRKVVKTNIGLENTSRRLELIYPEKHQLNVSESNKSYKVNLEIIL